MKLDSSLLGKILETALYHKIYVYLKKCEPFPLENFFLLYSLNEKQGKALKVYVDAYFKEHLENFLADKELIYPDREAFFLKDKSSYYEDLEEELHSRYLKADLILKDKKDNIYILDFFFPFVSSIILSLLRGENKLKFNKSFSFYSNRYIFLLLPFKKENETFFSYVKLLSQINAEKDFEFLKYLNNEDFRNIASYYLKPLQVSQYAISYVLSFKDDFKKDFYINLCYAHSFALNTFSFKVHLSLLQKEKENLKKYFSILKKIYLDIKTCKNKDNQNYLLKEKSLDKTYTFYTLPTSKNREKLKRELEEHFLKHKINLVLAPPATGKTTSLFKIIKEHAKHTKFLVFYISPRIILNQDKAKFFENDSNFEIFVANKENESKAYDFKVFYSFLTSSFSNSKIGKIKSVKLFLEQFIRKNKNKSVFISFTNQAIGNVYSYNTLKTHLFSHFRFNQYFYKDYKILFIFDEFTADENIKHTILDLLDFMQKYKNLNLYLYLLDASLRSKNAFLTLLDKEVSFYGLYIDDKKIKKDFPYPFSVQEYKTIFYPAKKLYFHEKYINLNFSLKIKDLEEEFVSKLSNFLEKEFLKKEKKVCVFLQDKRKIEKVKKKLSKYKVLALDYATRTSEHYNHDYFLKYDLVLFTSSASRGIDIPYENVVIIPPTFELVYNLNETLQAMYRIRDGKTDFEKEKHIYMLLFTDKESQILAKKYAQNILHIFSSYVEEKDKNATILPYLKKRNFFLNDTKDLLSAYQTFLQLYLNCELPISFILFLKRKENKLTFRVKFKEDLHKSYLEKIEKLLEKKEKEGKILSNLELIIKDNLNYLKEAGGIESELTSENFFIDKPLSALLQHYNREFEIFTYFFSQKVKVKTRDTFCLFLDKTFFENLMHSLNFLLINFEFDKISKTN